MSQNPQTPATYTIPQLSTAVALSGIEVFECVQTGNSVQATVQQILNVLGSGSVATANLTIANITTANITTANIFTSNETTANITTANITTANITAAVIATATITVANLATANITVANIATSNVTVSNIVTANVTTGNIQIGNIGSAFVTSVLTVNTSSLLVQQGVAAGTTTDPGFGNFYALNFLNSGSGFSRVPASIGQVSSTTFINVPNLSAALVTGKTYHFESTLHVTAGSTGGTRIQVAYPNGATNIVYDGIVYSGGAFVTQARALAAASPISATVAVAPTFRIVGNITAQNAGNMTVQIAQVAATTTTSLVLAGSDLIVLQMN